MSLHTLSLTMMPFMCIVGSPSAQVASHVQRSMLSMRAGGSHVPAASWVNLNVLQCPGGRDGGHSNWMDAPELHTLVQLDGCKSLVCVAGSETTETVSA